MSDHFSSKKCHFFSLFWLPFSHFMRPQTEFRICGTTFSPLQNGFKKSSKKRGNGVQNWLTMLTNQTVFIEKSYYEYFFSDEK